MSLVVFPFKQEDPRIAVTNVRIAASHPRIAEVLCVGSGRDEAYRGIAAAAPEIERETGTPVRLILQERRGVLRPGKGDAMTTGLLWFLEHTSHARIHFYDADITTFSAAWITKAEQRADEGYPVVRHHFPRASTDAMITWMITKPGLAMYWPDTALARVEQPLGGEILLERSTVEALVADPTVLEQSDWGIDTAITIGTMASGAATAEVYIPEGKLHGLYGSLTDIKDMAIECFAAVQRRTATIVPGDTEHRIEPADHVAEAVKEKVAYSVGDTVRLLRESWTDRQDDLLDHFDEAVARSMRASIDYPRLGFMDADRWYGVLEVLFDRFDMDDRDWRELMFRLWVARVLSYTVDEAVRGYDAAMSYLRGTITEYERRSRPSG